MNKKGRKGAVLGTCMFLLVLIALFHTYYSIYELKSSPFASKGISGKAIFSDIKENISGVDSKTKIILATEWLVVVLTVAYFLIKAKIKFNKEKKAEESVTIKEAFILPKKSRSETDLDLLYNLLQEKKSLSLSSISKYFKVDGKTAMYWCTILEEGDLAAIHYPTVGEPKIIINSNKLKQNEQ